MKYVITKLAILILILALISSFMIMSCGKNGTSPDVEDKEAPDKPEGLIAQALDEAIQLSWVANTEADLSGYFVYYKWGDDMDTFYPIEEFAPPIADTSILIGELNNDWKYTFVITAIDTSSNESVYSDTAIATPHHVYTAAELNLSAWARYESGLYNSAIIYFNQALDLDSTYFDSYNGLGWSYIALYELELADSSFNLGSSYAPAYDEILAGYSFVYSALNQDEEAINSANSVLSGDNNYVFSHNAQINYCDLRVLLAISYFNTGIYYEESDEIVIQACAQGQVNILDATNGLDPDVESTWNDAPTYEAALLNKIMSLKEEYDVD